MNVQFSGISQKPNYHKPIARNAQQVSFQGVNYSKASQSFLKAIDWKGFSTSIKAIWNKLVGTPSAIKPSLDKGNVWLSDKLSKLWSAIKPVAS